MTDYTELIKALRCCTSPHGKCEECSYFKIGTCRMQTQMDAADAIVELRKRIEYYERKETMERERHAPFH